MWVWKDSVGVGTDLFIPGEQLETVGLNMKNMWGEEIDSLRLLHKRARGWLEKWSQRDRCTHLVHQLDWFGGSS